MKYADLIRFEPIESVVQLRNANGVDDARRLVTTFVISQRMAEQFSELVVPHLQFDLPADTRGLLVVGTYGTGKSHLMAVISAVAEHSDLANALTNPIAAAAASRIGGRFKVIRAEIGSTTMSLRDIVCGVLEEGLAQQGVAFEFPQASERHENKGAILEMMAAFDAAYPDKGLLLVVDELLDYLRSRKDQELSLDLSFLREVGEVCTGTRFRFLAGIQETLFDNPRFQFVAETLRRVKDRFDQVRIAREDVAFVVAERLLRKSAEQQARIREHLATFAPFYGAMNERMDEFVRLFPVHPAYLDTFERVYVAEKREVLRTLSAAIRHLLDSEVPVGEPGLIAYDSYWSVLKDNPSFRSISEIREVIEKSDVLEARIQHAFGRPQYRPAAMRIIHGLAVHRLTTSDIYTPIGATAEELRDDLCLMLPVPERNAEFLRTVVETILQEIVRAASGQFIGHNADNGQYYLDLKKDIDFDALIEKKAESLDGDQLNRYYFDALRRVVLEDPEAPPYVSGYRIWEHELEWVERRAGRSGYLFFGAPNERSTAQPARDYYLYFLQLHDLPNYKDEHRPDEVFFRLRTWDASFETPLKRYAGAREQAASASGGNKKVYEDKASDHLRALTAWLREHMPNAYEVVHQGRARPLAKVIEGKVAGGMVRAAVRDLINAAGSAALAPHFQDLSPDYPTFSTPISRENRAQAAQDALRWIGGGVRSRLGGAVLDALQLIDGDQVKPRTSRYSAELLRRLEGKGLGQVLNRGELVEDVVGVEYWAAFRLEPEFLAVVLAALVYSGDLVLSLPGRKVDAASIDQLARLGAAEVAAFKYVERPRDLPVGPLQELLALLDLPQGLIVDPARREEAVTQMQGRVASVVERVVLTQARLPEMVLWGRPVLPEAEQGEWRQRLGGLKEFLESLQAFNTVGKLKNFPYDVTQVTQQRDRLAVLRQAEALAALMQQVAAPVAYLGLAEAVLGVDHQWAEGLRIERARLFEAVADPAKRGDAALGRQLSQSLTVLKDGYRQAYLAAHKRARLGVNEDRRKAEILQGPSLAKARRLAAIDIMPAQQLRELEEHLQQLKSCFALTEGELEAEPVCPHCGFRPVEEPTRMPAGQQLDRLDSQLDELVESWSAILLANLDDPDVMEDIALLSDGPGKATLATFMADRNLPDQIESEFVAALREVLGGLEKVVLRRDALEQALLAGGVPCTLEELAGRFRQHLAELARGKDPKKVRIVVE